MMTGEPIPSSKTNDLQQAQLKQLQLENEKLEWELANLRCRKSFYAGFIELIPIITTVLTIAGFWVGIWKYLGQEHRIAMDRMDVAEKESHERRNREKREVEQGKQDFMKPWLESQREIYIEALSAATEVAYAENPEQRATATNKFWRLYNGKMIMVETKDVSDAMKCVGERIRRTGKCGSEELAPLCRALATAMARSLATTAKMDYATFSANQFDYLKKKSRE